MGIESAPGTALAVSRGAASVSGPSIGFRGPAFEAAPVMAGPINEGPFRGSLEGFRPMSITDIKTIASANAGGGTSSFEEAPIDAEFTAADVIAGVEFTLAQARNSLVKERSTALVNVEQPVLYPLIVNRPNNQGVEEDIIDAEYRILPDKQLDQKGLHKPIHHILHPEVSSSKKGLGNELLVQKVRKTKHLEEEKYEQNLRKKRFVEDEKALGVVIIEFIDSIRRASLMATELGIRLSGPFLARFLPGQHAENEGEAVKGRGSDGSNPARREAIAAHGEYLSEYDARQKAIEEAHSKPPIKFRKEEQGKPVPDEHVATVFKDHPVKPPLEVVEQLTVVKREVRVAPVLEDYPDLAEALSPKIV